MQQAVRASSISFAGIAALILLLVNFVSPSHAAAATIQTSQLLPGQSSCQQLSITNLNPHVYDGMLESFDVTVSDANKANVGILSTVNNAPLPLDMITRWAGENEGLRFHVDIPDTPVYGSVPVTLTLLSSLPGQATCITNISFRVDASNNIVSQPDTESDVSIATQHAVAVHTVQKTPSHIVAKTPSAHGATSTNPQLVGAGIAAEGAAKGIGAICGTVGNAYKLWFILLVLYVVLVVVVIFIEPWFLGESVIASTASLLVPLLLLLVFWYFSENCRAASWIPVSACVIAIVGLFLAFREYETTPLLTAPNIKA